MRDNCFFNVEFFTTIEVHKASLLILKTWKQNWKKHIKNSTNLPMELMKEMQQHLMMKQQGQQGRKTKLKSQAPTKVFKVWNFSPKNHDSPTKRLLKFQS